ncbi:MAG: sensor histidine kinase [Acidobacteriaceae bacterium]
MSEIAAWVALSALHMTVAPWLLMMKFNTALAIFLCSLSLLLVVDSATPWKSRTVLALSALVLVLTAVILGEYLFSSHWGIDQLFVHDPTVGPYPGRIARLECISFLAISLALVLMAKRRLPNLMQTLLVLPLIANLLSLFGYLYNAPIFKIVSYRHIAAPLTLLCITILCIGLLCARPVEGFMSLVWKQSYAGRTLRFLAPITLLLPGMLGLMLSLYDHWHFNLISGMVLLTMFNALAFLVLFWVILGRLQVTELRRQSASDALWQSEKRYAQRLEQTVQARTQELEASLTRTRAILESSSDGICGFDVDCRVNFLNPAAEQMLRVRAQDVIGEPAGRLFHISGRDGLAVDPDAGLLREALRGSAAMRVENQNFWRTDDTSFPVECVATPIYLQQMLLGSMLTFRDISERNKIERIKSEFVSIVSHELRTPLTSIRAALGLISSGKLVALPPAAQNLAEVAIRNTDRLSRLIGDILDVERLESAQPRLQQTATTTTEVVRQTMECMREMIAQTEVNVVSQVDHLVLQVDLDRIVQVLTNLISNAVKFSKPGSQVTIGATQEPEWVHFTVSDTGLGIPADKLGLIFERFQQVDSSDIRDKGGSGLGLTIARAIVRQHGGQIWVQSEVNQGSTFHFTLPQRRKSDHNGHLPLGLS